MALRGDGPRRSHGACAVLKALDLPGWGHVILEDPRYEIEPRPELVVKGLR